jgi:starch synthase
VRVLFIASEAAPYAKTGGLADVIAALPRALRRLGVEAAVLMPRYGFIDLTHARRVYDWLPVHLAGARYDTSVYLIDDGVPHYLIDCPPLYGRPQLYGEPDTGDYPDNHLRFGVFCRAAFGVMRHLFRPHIAHLHDWQTGLAPVYLKTRFAMEPTFVGLRTLFTIHNLGYHGLFPPERMAELELDRPLYRADGLEFWGRFAFIKGGLIWSDELSTVSRRYAEEIQTPEFGFGLDGLLRARRDSLVGILNGVDYSYWNPETDPLIAANYSAADLAGKRLCKRELLHVMGLDERAIDRPVFGVVSRLVEQKGADLIAAAASEFEALDAYLVCLGSGDAYYEAVFQRMERSYPHRIAVRLGYDNRLAHQIEAGADAFVMPSRYEPCGLNQMYSLRYGTVPVVRATGGLDDTIKAETGFKFFDYSEWAFRDALRAACAAYADQGRWMEMMRRGMRENFSWDVSAARYAELYRELRPGLNPAEAGASLTL